MLKSANRNKTLIQSNSTRPKKISPPKDKKDKVGRDDEYPDTVSLLVKHNLQDVLRNIFLYLNPEELWTCRRVCKVWHKYLKLEFWKDLSIRKILLKRLALAWSQEKHERSQLNIDKTCLSCRANCELNLIICDCPLSFNLSGNCLDIQHGSSHVSASLSVNNQELEQVLHTWEKGQDSVKLDINNQLRLSHSSFLSKPLFFETKLKKLKVLFEDKIVVVEESDPSYITIKSKSSSDTICKFQPYTGWGEPKPITRIVSCSGRLAVLTSGRVFVYCLQKLIRDGPSESGATALLLVATRQSQPSVEFLYLQHHKLITIGGTTITMFNFWTDNPSPVSEFFT